MKTPIASLVAAALWATANPDAAMALYTTFNRAADAVAGTNAGTLEGFMVDYQWKPQLLTIGAASAPDAQYQVWAFDVDFTNDPLDYPATTAEQGGVMYRDNIPLMPSTYVLNVTGADLLKSINIDASGWVGRYNVSIYSTCSGGSCTRGNLLATSEISLNPNKNSQSNSPSCANVPSLILTNGKLSVTVTDECLASGSFGNVPFSVLLWDSEGNAISQLFNAEQLSKGATIYPTPHVAGGYNLNVKGPCVVGVSGSYDCSGATINDAVQFDF